MAAYHAADLAVIAALLAAGADVNARDWAETTPLHRTAAGNHDPAIVAALIEAGADVNPREGNRRTPLHMSHGNRNPEVVRALLAAGADPLARDDRGRIADPGHCEHWNTRAFRPDGDR